MNALQLSLIQEGASGASDLPAPDMAELQSQMGLFGLVMLAGGLVIAPWVIQLARKIYPGRNIEFARWGFSHVLVATGLFGLTTILVAQFVVPLIQDPDVLTQLGITVLLFLVPSVYIVRTAFLRSPDGLRALALTRSGTVRAMLCGLVSYTLFLPALFGVALIVPWLFELLGTQYEPQGLFAAFAKMSGARYVGALVLAVLVQPFLEEIVFRGFLQPLLVQNFGDRGGVAATAFIFAFVHGYHVFLPVFALALVLGGVMLRTRRLLAPFVVHAVHNGLMLALLKFGGEQLLQSS